MHHIHTIHLLTNKACKQKGDGKRDVFVNKIILLRVYLHYILYKSKSYNSFLLCICVLDSVEWNSFFIAPPMVVQISNALSQQYSKSHYSKTQNPHCLQASLTCLCTRKSVEKIICFISNDDSNKNINAGDYIITFFIEMLKSCF